ncbi:mucin-like protein isoform X2 [Mercenaria mercenaria]|uniref:mucin-like protein isoform X2 n=1 Tax=Mercenaria mercenaria TaxID=6596 RepID=UPI00234EC914|nr:mucin-like protein isoform X2 [Mercenaria mercenaria]
MEQLVMKARGKIKQLVLLLVYMLLVGTEAEITSAYSWGGAEITTVDQHTYSFNGHGEYTFLETSNQSLQIQARTDFMIEGNTDATIFVAFVLSVNLKNDTITIVYNRTDRLLYLYQHDGSLWTNSNGSKHPEPSTNRGFILVCTPPYGFIVMPTQRISIRKLTFSGHNFMGITVDTYGRDVVDLKGLAGNLVQGYFIAGNGSKVKSNSTERQMFEFGETWTVSESESKFNYSITGGNYTFWNGRHDVPKFLQDIAEKGDLLRLFEGFSDANITLFNETCRNSWDMQPNIQCLVVIGTTEDVTLGQAVMKAAEERHYKYLLQHNKPPHFKNNTPTFLNVTLGTNLKILDVKLYVTDDFDDPDEMTYNVITQVKNYTFNNGSFTWNVGTYLRYSDSSLTFTVNDTLGYLAARQIIIYYCGCENPSQCDFRSFNNNSSATIQKAACKCPAYSGGLYCEVQLDPCKDYTCYENNCNGYFNRNSPAWPCADCPEGKTNLIASYKQTCENINECTVGPNPCGQICNDTDGSYKCFCKEGFTLNIDGHKCDDIDECTLTPSKCTGENEVCLNIEGNFSCICKPGYSKKSDACEQEGGYTYVGHMSFTILVNAEHVSVINKTIDTYQNRKDIQDKIAAGFNNTKGFLGVEVFRLTLLIHQGNKTRPQAGRYDVRADYVVHWRNVTDIKDIDSENILCNLTSNGNCDPATTDCQQQNGTTVCKCKDGYGKLNPSEKFCIDIDECAENKTDCSGHGNCRNMLGDYTCDCDKGFIFNETNKSCEDFDECYYNYTVCGNREICINTVGAFKCICAPGYFRASKNEPCKIPDIRHYTHL